MPICILYDILCFRGLLRIGTWQMVSLLKAEEDVIGNNKSGSASLFAHP
jgi:hypothetical protein